MLQIYMNLYYMIYPYLHGMAALLDKGRSITTSDSQYALST